MKKLTIGLVVLALAGFASAALITNPGFETGDKFGWSEALSGSSATVSSAYANSGTYSLAIDNTGAGQWSSPNLFQAFSAAPGDVITMSGYMLQTVAAQPSNWATIKVEWKDSLGANIEPLAGPAIGAVDGSGEPYVGVVGSPQVNSASAVDTWVFTEIEAIAPTGTVGVNFYLLNVNGDPVSDTFYFDDVVAVPEPATMGLFALAGGLLMFVRRFRFKV